MRVMGIKNGKDSFGWVIVEGESRYDAYVLDHREITAPNDARPKQLAWLRRELKEVLGRHGIDSASIRLAEAAQSGSPNFSRAEMDGVVQATLAELDVPVRSFKSATVRGCYGKTNAQMEAAWRDIPCISSSAKVRRDQLAVAVAQFPETQSS